MPTGAEEKLLEKNCKLSKRFTVMAKSRNANFYA